MPSRQTFYNRKKSIAALEALAPDLVKVSYIETKFNHTAQFRAETLDGYHSYEGRYQVVYAWICGLITAKHGSQTFRFTNKTMQ